MNAPLLFCFIKSFTRSLNSLFSSSSNGAFPTGSDMRNSRIHQKRFDLKKEKKWPVLTDHHKMNEWMKKKQMGWEKSYSSWSRTVWPSGVCLHIYLRNNEKRTKEWKIPKRTVCAVLLLFLLLTTWRELDGYTFGTYAGDENQVNQARVHIYISLCFTPLT